jgi:hypothetical protein
MFKKWFSIFIALGLVLMFVGMSEARLRHFKIDVYKALTNDALSDIERCTKLTDDVHYLVTVHSGTTVPTTIETIYSDKGLTAMAQEPWVLESTFDDKGYIEFWCDPTESGDAQVRLLVTDAARGFSWTGSVHYRKDKKIIINEIPGIVHQLTIAWGGADASRDNVDTLVDLSPGMLIIDAYVYITSVGVGTDVSPSLGYRGSEQAYIASVSSAAIGMSHDDVFDTAFQMVTRDATDARKDIYYIVGGNAVNAVTTPSGFFHLLVIPY